MKHGFKKTRFYTIWHHMKQRCQNENRKDYNLYGGKGVKVCEDWSEFLKFKDDMHETYLEHVLEYGEKETTLDRMDSKGHYEPNNCRWATTKEQLKNRGSYNPHKRRVGVDPKGKVYSFNNHETFAIEHGLSRRSITDCLNNRQKTHKGWSFYYVEVPK